MTVPTVSEIGEDRLVAAVLDRMREVSASDTRGAAPVVGAGDDAAVLPAGAPTVLSTDTLVEHVDFRTEWSTAADVGGKAVAAGLADIAAMGAVPEAVLISLTVPAGTDVAWVLGLAEGVARESARAGARVIGGDVADGREIVVTVTATGRLTESGAVLRSGARPGDVVALAGVLGESAAGLALLEAGADLADDPGLQAVAHRVLGRHRHPRPPYAAGPRAALAGATSLIDVSDGLVRDARRVATASGVAIDLDTTRLAPTAELSALAGAIGGDARDWLLTGGEDHALLATFPEASDLPEGYRVVGTARAPGPAAVLVDGRPWTGRGGFTHFGG